MHWVGGGAHPGPFNNHTYEQARGKLTCISLDCGRKPGNRIFHNLATQKLLFQMAFPWPLLTIYEAIGQNQETVYKECLITKCYQLFYSTAFLDV